MRKGLNNITLPVYNEIMKELPNIIEKNQLLPILEMDFEAPLTQEDIDLLLECRYVIKDKYNAVTSQLFYPVDWISGMYIAFSYNNDDDFFVDALGNIDDMGEGDTIEGYIRSIPMRPKLYKHILHFSTSSSFMGDSSVSLAFISTSPNKLTSSAGITNKVPITQEIINKISDAISTSKGNGFAIPCDTFLGYVVVLGGVVDVGVLSNNTYTIESWNTAHWVSEYPVKEIE